MAFSIRPASIIVSTTIASIAFLTTGFIVQRGFVAIKNANDVINVTGSAKRNITSDLAGWAFTLRSSDNVNLQNAYRAFQAAQPVIDNFLQKQQFKASELTYDPVNSGPQKYMAIELVNGKNEMVEHTRYVVSKTYHIQTTGIAKLQKTVGAATTAFVQASTGGISVDSGDIKYLYTKLADVRVELLEEASKDAQRRAQAIAQSSGNTIGAVKNARVGVFQITPRFETSIEDVGSYDTTSLEKDVTAVVQIDFVVR